MVYSILGNQFTRRKKIIINTTTAISTNYQINIVVTYSPNMNSDFSDLRFISSAGNSLDYWIASYTPSVTASVWIELELSIGASSSIKVYSMISCSIRSNTSG